MSNDLWFISDTHFGHANILKFVNYDGDKVRPEFDSVQDMDETMIERWNSVVKPGDKVYHLGDVAFFEPAYHKAMERLNGKKRLILGNHDKFRMKDYLIYFEKVQESWQPVRNILFTHRPIFMGGMEGFEKFNVHGHVHRTRNQLSPQHLNISIEMTNYTPIHWDEICTKLGTSNER